MNTPRDGMKLEVYHANETENIFSLLEIILLGSGLVLLVLVVSQLQTSGGSQVEETIEPFPTPTPSPGDMGYPPPPMDRTPPPLSISLTPTPMDDPNWTPPPTDVWEPYSTVIDLSPELSENEEYFVFVQIETGEVIIYTIGPVDSGLTDPLPQFIVTQLPLGNNDILLSGVPPYPFRRTLSELLGWTPTPTLTPTQTLNPYPFGWTPTFTPTFTPTINPYP